MRLDVSLVFETPRGRFRNEEKLKQKIGERSVLFLGTFQALAVHVVLGEAAETPNKIGERSVLF